ncbi:tetratricopeptide repeat protein 28 isoform X1 [Corythoichthys intestinalis]|uniref:tetratricopeptide repeat protein 28 isoform X1 n=1 Tax=Corythoichthys intestinalis TaxID=161448 RepID=UPI0025A66A22|nr:tetratricopeptide repeat protein 28 isoform X1 [Corythoichthys intestinalis]
MLSYSSSDLPRAPSSSSLSSSSVVAEGAGPWDRGVSDGVRLSERACRQGDYVLALRLCTEALGADPLNCVAYSTRSAAHLGLRRYRRALRDANKARDLNPKWNQAYFRQAVALQHLGRHGEALAAFASGVAQDPKSLQLLTGMVEAAMKSPLKGSLEPTYRQLRAMKLERSPFTVVSLIGQELLTHGFHGAAAEVLESALQIGTCSLKMRGSVFSALSAAYWSLGDAEKSLAYMQRDLDVARTLGDQTGECRGHGNLGSAHFSKGRYREALANYRQQLILAMKLKHKEAASAALGGLGHIYAAIGDYPNALASHKQCVALARQNGHRLSEARQLGDLGAVYAAMGDAARALRCHQQHLDIAKTLGDRREEARAYSNLGSAHHSQRDYSKAESCHSRVLKLAQELGDRTVEMRAFAGLGHAARCNQDLEGALRYHQRQLEISEELQDTAARGRASSNLGIIHQMRGDYKLALKLHKAHLTCAQELGDYGAQGRAYGNMGNAYHALGLYEQAVGFHRQELNISLEVNDRPSQASTHGNLAVAYQALGALDRALQHYMQHLTISRELRDIQSEARALANLGNFHCRRGDYSQALPYYQQYLLLTPSLQDPEGEGRVCHNLGYAYYCLRQYQDAVRYYEQDLALAKDLQNKLAQAKAYCNLGLAHKALGEFSRAEECQRNLLQIAQALDNKQATFRALGHLGDVSVCRGDLQGADSFYRQQLSLAQNSVDHKMEADAYSALGSVHRSLGQLDTSLSFHSQELTLRKDLGDHRGECHALGHLAGVHMALGDYVTTLQCYEAQLNLAQRLHDSHLESQVHGNMGITKMNMGHFEEAIGFLEEQLATLEPLSTRESMPDRGKAYGNLADCYDALGDFEEAVRFYDKALAVAQSLKQIQDQEKAYRGLGNAHRSLGNLQQALVCFEKRLVVAHELGGAGKAQAYGELGALHSQLGNYEQALSCLEQQLSIARSAEDKSMEAEASDALGSVYQLMADYETARQWHQRALDMAEQAGCVRNQTRAYGNLGVTYEALGNYERALVFQEQHLSMAAQTNDLVAKTQAYESLGRIHHALGNYAQAVMYLQEGLRQAEQSARREDEAKIRHRLGLSLLAAGNLEEARHQLYRASLLFETIRCEIRHSPDYKLSLFDLQTSSYHALQRVLVSLGCHEEALTVAERGRTRAFADLLVERQNGCRVPACSDRHAPVTAEHILETVNSQKGLVLYFSIAGGFLYSWLLCPGSGIVKFNQAFLGTEVPELKDGSCSSLGGGLLSLEHYVCNAREFLGIDGLLNSFHVGSETESEAGDVADQHFEELHKMSSDDDPSGYLRTVSRNNIFNRSCRSISSSKEGSSTTLSLWSGTKTSPLQALYDLLIAPMETALLHGGGPVGRRRQLVLVLEGDLYLVPFALLKGSSSDRFLYEMFSILCVPSLASMRASRKISHLGDPLPRPEGGSWAAVVGVPNLSPGFMRRWLWGPLPSAQDEALWLGERLGCRPLTGADATKERALAALTQAQCVHFATHVSWKLASLVLAPSREPPRDGDERSRQDEESLCESACGTPPLQDVLLTAADILELNLSSKLVVLRLYPESGVRLTSDGLLGLTGAFLSAGVRCVCVSLWPTSPPASKLFMQTFYSVLLNGAHASTALNDAMRTLQQNQDFAHPSNWAGYLLIGSDVKVTGLKFAVRQALVEVLGHVDRARGALRVLLHLVEKSLQRIHSGHSNPMYTSQQSVDNKVGGVPGWRSLLSALGFRLEPGNSSLPAAVFFPRSDPGERLQKCSLTMQALLGLSAAALEALCKLVSAPEVGEQLIHKFRQVLGQLRSADGERSSAPVPMSLGVRLWRLAGCHEFLAALGFDLCEVGREEVLLKTGKQANEHVINLALRSLLGLFDHTDLCMRPNTCDSSSLESLSPSPKPCPTRTPLPPRPSFNSAVCPEAPCGDAVSVYSLSSLTSALSFPPRPEPAGSDVVSSQEVAETPCRAGRMTRETGDEDYQGYAIISSEPLRPGDCDVPTVECDGGEDDGRRSSNTSVPASQKKEPPPKVPAKPRHKPGIPSSQRRAMAGKGETSADSVVEYQDKWRVAEGQLDPRDLARKIMEETRDCTRVAESPQGSPERRSLSTPATPILNRRAQAFQPSETSAFSRLPSRTGLALSPLLPRPPRRSSSLQKLVPSSFPHCVSPPGEEVYLKHSSGSESHQKTSSREPRLKSSPGQKSQLKPSPQSESQLKPSGEECHVKPSPHGESQLKAPGRESNLKPVSGGKTQVRPPGRESLLKSPMVIKSHLKPSPQSESHLKVPGTESHFRLSSGSKDHLNPPSRDFYLKPIPGRESQHNSPHGSKSHLQLHGSESHREPASDSKCFEAARKYEGASPASFLPGKKMSRVQKDLLGLLDLSPRHEPGEGPEHLNNRAGTKAPFASKLPKPSKFGYKFLAGHFIPSSKC